jgi:hypothetical protein
VDERDDGLSDQAMTILGLIAEGRSYDQILRRHPALTYFDIFAAARAALDLLQTTSTTPQRLDAPAPAEPDRPPYKRPESPESPDGLDLNASANADGELETADWTARACAEPDGRPTEPDAGPAEPAPVKRLPAHIERARATHSRAWARWTRDEDAKLTALFRQGASRAAIGEALGRQPGAIERRLLKLGLIAEADGEGAVAVTAAPDLSFPPLPVHAPPVSGPPDSAARPAPTAPPRRRTQATQHTAIVPGWEAFRDRLSPDQDEA